MKKEVKRLEKLAKKIISRDTYKKLQNIKDLEEKKLALEFAIISELKKENLEIQNQINRLEEKAKDIFFIKNTSLLIPGKIKHVEVEYNENELIKLLNLINKTKKEIKCLTS